MNDERDMQLDFMAKLDGIRLFEGLKSRSKSVRFGERELKIACLADVIKSKRAAGHDRDRAVPDILQKSLNEREKG